VPNLRDYFRDLLIWEEEPHCELIHAWVPELRDMIVSAFEISVSETAVKGSRCSIAGLTNQAAGNTLEKYIVAKLDSGLSGFSISKCRGAGYPDQTLIQSTTGLQISLEVKATADWNDTDTIRRVITSSSKKLRARFSEPIYHLILTVIYLGRGEDFAKIEAIRLDFLEPTTLVDIKFEASVNHKILVEGSHYSKTI
jgi:hypothetical protein